MKSISHKSLFTGILDKNGNKIYNGSKIKVNDIGWVSKDNPNNEGIVVWRRGNYEVKGTPCAYNVYAWRKNIEVLEPKGEALFIKEDFDSLWETFSRTLSITEPSRKEIKRALKYGYEIQIENSL